MTIEAIDLIPPLVCLRPESSQLHALRLMLKHDASHAPVCDDHAGWLGLVSLADLLGELLPAQARMGGGLDDHAFHGDDEAMMAAHIRDMEHHSVAERVRSDLPTLRRDHNLMEATLLLYRHGVPLPVLASDGHLLGLLSSAALARHLAAKAGF